MKEGSGSNYEKVTLGVYVHHAVHGVLHNNADIRSRLKHTVHRKPVLED